MVSLVHLSNKDLMKNNLRISNRVIECRVLSI